MVAPETALYSVAAVEKATHQSQEADGTRDRESEAPAYSIDKISYPALYSTAETVIIVMDILSFQLRSKAYCSIETFC